MLRDILCGLGISIERSSDKTNGKHPRLCGFRTIQHRIGNLFIYNADGYAKVCFSFVKTKETIRVRLMQRNQ